MGRTRAALTVVSTRYTQVLLHNADSPGAACITLRRLESKGPITKVYLGFLLPCPQISVPSKFKLNQSNSTLLPSLFGRVTACARCKSTAPKANTRVYLSVWTASTWQIPTLSNRCPDKAHQLTRYSHCSFLSSHPICQLSNH